MKKLIAIAVLITTLSSCSKDQSNLKAPEPYTLERTGTTYTATFYQLGYNTLDVYFKGLKGQKAYIGWRITGNGRYENTTVVPDYFKIDSISYSHR